MRTYEQKQASIWRDRFIKAVADIANQGGAEVASAHLREYEENALIHLLDWEERLNRDGHTQPGAY